MVTPWPRDTDGIVRIKYCFASADAKADLADEFSFALNTWFARMGTPGSAHGHALAKPEEFAKDGNPLLCRNADKSWSKMTLPFRA
jgi:hypothetical protein